MNTTLVLSDFSDVLKRAGREVIYDLLVKEMESVRKNPNYEVHIKDGLYHRTDGPAIICLSDGRGFWVVNGVLIHSLEEFLHFCGMSEEEKMVFKLKHSGTEFND